MQVLPPEGDDGDSDHKAGCDDDVVGVAEPGLGLPRSTSGHPGDASQALHRPVDAAFVEPTRAAREQDGSGGCTAHEAVDRTVVKEPRTCRYRLEGACGTQHGAVERALAPRRQRPGQSFSDPGPPSPASNGDTVAEARQDRRDDPDSPD